MFSFSYVESVNLLSVSLLNPLVLFFFFFCHLHKRDFVLLFAPIPSKQTRRALHAPNIALLILNRMNVWFFVQNLALFHWTLQQVAQILVLLQCAQCVTVYTATQECYCVTELYFQSSSVVSESFNFWSLYCILSCNTYCSFSEKKCISHVFRLLSTRCHYKLLLSNIYPDEGVVAETGLHCLIL